MRPLDQAEIADIVSKHGLTYQAVEHDDPLVVRTVISKTFPISQQQMFDAFADPVAHVGLFSIIVGSTPPIRKGLEGVLAPNEYFAFEHVQESSLPPRIMIMKYTLNPPHKISKVGITDPFLPGDALTDNVLAMHPMDKKKASVTMKFDAVGDQETRLTTDGEFVAETGAIFARGFIDHVWLNFFERLMVANGTLTERDMKTEPKLTEVKLPGSKVPKPKLR
jgi:hypothetical protein